MVTDPPGSPSTLTRPRLTRWKWPLCSSRSYDVRPHSAPAWNTAAEMGYRCKSGPSGSEILLTPKQSARACDGETVHRMRRIGFAGPGTRPIHAGHLRGRILTAQFHRKGLRPPIVHKCLFPNTVRIVVARHLQGRFSRAWSPGPATCPSDSSRTNGLNRTVLGHGLARLVCIATRHPDRFGGDDLVLSRTASHCVSCDDWQTNCSVGQRRLHLHGRAPGVNEQSLVHDSGREAGTRYGPMRH